MPDGKVLALNCGSSSLKFGVYAVETLVFEGEAEEIGGDSATLWTRVTDQLKQEKKLSAPDHSAAFKILMQSLSAAGLAKLDAVGHRIVHGGSALRDHHKLDERILQKLTNAVPFAPLHLPPALSVIDAVSKARPDLPQFVCLDTAFHKNLPDIAKTLPFSGDIRNRGIERYGFHGLSVESIVEQLKPPAPRTVVAHLGNGSSITALEHGRSIDTTMGLTPSGGVMMGTRCGDIDPGVLIYLLRQGFDAQRLESAVDHEGGLRGVSGRSNDVRKLVEARASDAGCDLALRMFVQQVKKAVAAMAVSLNGLDELVFTGGIGEHADAIRSEIVSGLGFLKPFKTSVLPSQEDLQIARITQRLLA